MVELVGVLFGLLLIAGGALGTKYAYRISWVGEQLDAIGSKRGAGGVEPADWNVLLTKALSVILAGVGVMVLLMALFE